MLAYSVGDVIQRVLAILRLDAALLARNGMQVAVIWIFAWIAIRLTRLAARRIELAVDDGDPTVTTLREKRGQTIAQLLRSVGRVVIIVIAILLSLNVFINIGPLLAGAGILGLAVSFGAQSLVKDVISGFFILLENQFAIGDVIEAAGKGGVVERMTLRVVQLRDVEGTLHTIPNGEIKVVSNRTRGWARAVVDLTVPYSVEIERALAIFRQEAARFSEDPAYKPRLEGTIEVWGVEAFTDAGFVVRTVARTAPGSQWEIGRNLRQRLKLRLDAEGIETPLPQRVTLVRGEPQRLPEAVAARTDSA
ncbi:MAG TPA: mechanosensitive ion channel family protein [Gemmatimonadales bacterium]|nr:mechanosensitive ion channel family protein [Gemmatimonadales bacterium]